MASPAARESLLARMQSQEHNVTDSDCTDGWCDNCDDTHMDPCEALRLLRAAQRTVRALRDALADLEREASA